MEYPALGVLRQGRLRPMGSPMTQLVLWPEEARVWSRVTKFDPRACSLADRHYSRRSPGSNQFMPPGETVVLLTPCARAVFGWWRPHPRSGLCAWNGLSGWVCTIFRNEGAGLSSLLILAAEVVLRELGRGCGPDGLLTYVWDARVRSTNPGRCFKAAGWCMAGRSANGQKTLLHKPWNLCGQSPRLEDHGRLAGLPRTLLDRLEAAP